MVVFVICNITLQVVLKIIKHCQNEGSAGELVQGVLLGLIQDNKLEITNCFPFPSSRAGEDDDEDDGMNINPLSPGIKLQILLSCRYTFLTEVVGRSC